MQKTIKKLFRQNETYVFLILLALSFLIQVRSGQFYTSNNIVDIASAMIVPGLFAVGEFLVILSGGIDVSFPALASLTAYATTKLFLNLDYQGSVLLPMLTAIVIGAVLGMFNGFFVSFLRLPAMIVTLGTASVFKGIMQGTLESKQLAVIPAGMKAFGKQAIYTATNPVSGLSSKLPAAFLVFVGVLLLTFLVLRYTMFGRGIYAIGGNESAAYNAGFAGGTAIVGGKGTLTGCVLGTLLIVLVENSMILIGVPVVWKDVFVGLLIVIGTAVSAYQATHSGTKRRTRTQAKEAQHNG